MEGLFTITSDEDAERLRQQMQDEMGLTDKEWWLETDPNDPPFAVGDKVMVEKINSSGPMTPALVKLVREEQEIENLMPIPCSDGPLWSIDLVGCPLLFSNHDLRKV